jgi:hypothetical protein
MQEERASSRLARGIPGGREMAEKRNLSTALAIASLVALAAIGIAATVAPSLRMMPATVIARARVWGDRAVASAADRVGIFDLEQLPRQRGRPDEQC